MFVVTYQDPSAEDLADHWEKEQRQRHPCHHMPAKITKYAVLMDDDPHWLGWHTDPSKASRFNSADEARRLVLKRLEAENFFGYRRADLGIEPA